MRVVSKLRNIFRVLPCAFFGHKWEEESESLHCSWEGSRVRIVQCARCAVYDVIIPLGLAITVVGKRRSQELKDAFFDNDPIFEALKRNSAIPTMGGGKTIEEKK